MAEAGVSVDKAVIPTVVPLAAPSSTVLATVSLSVGTDGAVVSTRTWKALDTELTLPARSVICAVKEYVPSASGVPWTRLHWPLPSAVVVPIGVPPRNTWTELCGSAVPRTVSVWSVVNPSPAIFVSSITPDTTGVTPTVSTVTMKSGEAALTLPARSVAVAVNAYVPSLSDVPT